MVQGVVVVNNKLHNVPPTLGNDWPLRTPGNARTETVLLRAVTVRITVGASATRPYRSDP